MDHLKLCILLLCLMFSWAELLGPNTRKGSERRDPENKDDPSQEFDEEDEAYLKQLTEAMNSEFVAYKEFQEALRKRGAENNERNLQLLTDAFNKEFAAYKSFEEALKKRGFTLPDEERANAEELAHLEKMSVKLNRVKKEIWKQAEIEKELLAEKKRREDRKKKEDHTQELLDKLPPLPEEPQLSPELKEAKEMYDAAVKKLDRRSPDRRALILQVKEAAEKGYVPAQIKLAWSYVFGEGVELDVGKAHEIFKELAEQGEGDAHSGMGFLYATGVGVPVCAARALLHYTLGALAGSEHALMALAYRHWAGVGVPSSCPRALQLYRTMAAKVVSQVSMSGGPAIQRTRLLDEAESGAAVALDTDLIEYYQLLAEKGDVQAQVGLGQLHLQGGRGVTLDMNKALHYFQQAAKAGNAVANAFLGKIYLEGGDGIKPDNDTALRYFRKAAEMNNPVGQSGLGLMYLQGRGVPKDVRAAFQYFTLAANQGWVEGQLNLGFLYFGGIGVSRDFRQANKYFSLASQSGHVLALYHLAQMNAEGLGVLRSCTTAVELYKNVCERGGWASRLMAAHASWRAREPLSALLQYLALAERGVELAQSNAAYLLDAGEVQIFSEPERWARALQLWSRAAAQGYAPARVKLGDYHYYGLGTPVDLEAAAHHYRIASEQLHNAQATFNLGYMHERGLGLAQDAHLAKRCYDLAADSAPDARLPAALALARLHAAQLLARLLDSPLAWVFLTGESPFFSNWDLYIMTLLAGALGFLVYVRRPPQQQQQQQQQAEAPQQQEAPQPAAPQPETPPQATPPQQPDPPQPSPPAPAAPSNQQPEPQAVN
ncbi:protein sel-1 homolog 1 isoform X2 [Epargyreus clarus]|uniref:protein sel-1 homolog 1 isoform X2 n=1 Tax=Epargyreus clarus TaxID=520877 RepID=UPI003C2BFE9E